MVKKLLDSFYLLPTRSRIKLNDLPKVTRTERTDPAVKDR